MATKLVPQEMLFTGGTRTGSIRPVVKVEAIPPSETNRGIPIRNEYWAVKCTADNGDVRWFGFTKVWIGSDLRMHVSDVDSRDEVRMRWEDALD